jgi:hypothetical protein
MGLGFERFSSAVVMEIEGFPIYKSKGEVNKCSVGFSPFIIANRSPDFLRDNSWKGDPAKKKNAKSKTGFTLDFRCGN